MVSRACSFALGSGFDDDFALGFSPVFQGLPDPFKRMEGENIRKPLKSMIF
jgi:hypothetical protein